MIKLITKITSKFFGNDIGSDEFGNIYYRNSTDTKRWVIYNGIDEPSKVPAEWHLWLHYTTNTIPTDSSIKKYAWQKI